ncbi:putative O-glycosylation ligase, exosortase A system-associated [Sphingomonas bacterium]|uniref:putative O-glycosylation ligase, exosortase A system-associated n=1 Tax=Sphingomonas bacterium TaxID=1895847 RepID=UPI002624A4F4|nr:putative O-glycosylation ligase, exosortase A system-associated [Sphingomonas bacterium]
MHDLAFVGYLLALMGLALRRPFLFILTYVYIDIVSPQRLTYTLLNTVPISLIAVALAVASWAVVDRKEDTRIAPRQLLIVLLLGWCAVTTMRADFPMEALDKWDWVWKCLAFAAFLPLTLRTRLRIESLLTFMILSAASIIIVGGIKTAAGGGGYGSLDLMVTNNSGLYEGSTISTVAIAIIPTILWLGKYGTIFKRDWKVKLFTAALVFACLLIPIGTSTRTGLLCIGLLALLLLRDARRKFLYLGMIGALGLVAVPFLPKSFTDRMSTIQTYQQDESAATRVAVWKWTWEYVKLHPMGGGFEMYRQNQIRYDIVKADGVAGNAKLDTTLTTDRARAYHSAYFEMLGEQGWPGFLLWMAISLTGIVRMEVIRRRYRKAPEKEAWIAPLAGALQAGQILYMLGACFIAIAFQPFMFMMIGAQIGLDTYLKRKRAETSFRPMGRRNRSTDPQPALA